MLCVALCRLVPELFVAEVGSQKHVKVSFAEHKAGRLLDVLLSSASLMWSHDELFLLWLIKLLTNGTFCFSYSHMTWTKYHTVITM